MQLHCRSRRGNENGQKASPLQIIFYSNKVSERFATLLRVISASLRWIYALASLQHLRVSKFFHY